jgi:hypothetical protein
MDRPSRIVARKEQDMKALIAALALFAALVALAMYHLVAARNSILDAIIGDDPEE